MKHNDLASAQASLSKAEFTLDEVKQSLDTAQKKIKELQVFLQVSQEDQKKVENDTYEMHLDNIFMSKECAKSLEDSYPIT